MYSVFLIVSPNLNKQSAKFLLALDKLQVKHHLSNSCIIDVTNLIASNTSKSIFGGTDVDVHSINIPYSVKNYHKLKKQITQILMTFMRIL